MTTANAFGHAHQHGFVRHLVEMTLAMVIGMIASAAVFVMVSGLTVDEALRSHAVPFVIVQASGMTAVMVAWMRHRSHPWRGCLEMAAAMAVPAIVLIVLRLLDVISGSICGAYCGVSIAAMVLLMLYRRSEYTAHLPVTRAA